MLLLSVACCLGCPSLWVLTPPHTTPIHPSKPSLNILSISPQDSCATPHRSVPLRPRRKNLQKWQKDLTPACPVAPPKGGPSGTRPMPSLIRAAAPGPKFMAGSSMDSEPCQHSPPVSRSDPITRCSPHFFRKRLKNSLYFPCSVVTGQWKGFRKPE